MIVIALITTTTLILLTYFFYFHKTKNSNQTSKAYRSTLIVLGSGGHTAEMVRILQGLISASAMDSAKQGQQEKKRRIIYEPRMYVYADTDKLSGSKIALIETSPARIKQFKIPRSREVGQSWVSTIWTFSKSLIVSFTVVLNVLPDLIVCNGPGTCIPICCWALIFNAIGLSNTRIIFVESVARVETLSLTGKILYHLSHLFLVQWSELRQKYPNAKFIGRFI